MSLFIGFLIVEIHLQMGSNTGLYMFEQTTHYVIKRDATNKKKKIVRIHGKKKNQYFINYLILINVQMKKK